MRRRLFNFCATISLLICIAVSLLWVRSYYWWESVAIWSEIRQTDRYGYGPACFVGVFVYGTQRYEFPESARDEFVLSLEDGERTQYVDRYSSRIEPYLRQSVTEQLRTERKSRFGGVEDEVYMNDRGIAGLRYRVWALTLPCWIPTVGFAGLPMAWVVESLRRRRSHNQVGLLVPLAAITDNKPKSDA